MIRHALSLSAILSTLLLAGPLSAAPVAAAKPGPAPAAVAEQPPVTLDPACTTTRRRSADGRIGYFRHCPDSPELVAFRGGSYRMGDAIGNGRSFERPAHMVTIKPFAIGRYEVTRGEWQACVAAGVCTPSRLVPEASEAGPQQPITGVSWLQAKVYVSWLAQRTGRPYRLPTEAEWEYAARAGTEIHYSWNASLTDEITCQRANALDRRAATRYPEMTWFLDCDDGYSQTAPVGSYAPNLWGVHDMVGNVWEWVEDCWHPDFTGAPGDGSAWLDSGEGANCRKRVNRGGGWGNGLSALRLSNRDADPASNHSDGLGLRVALSVGTAKPVVPAAEPPPAAAAAVPPP